MLSVDGIYITVTIARVPETQNTQTVIRQLLNLRTRRWCSTM